MTLPTPHDAIYDTTDKEEFDHTRTTRIHVQNKQDAELIERTNRQIQYMFKAAGCEVGPILVTSHRPGREGDLAYHKEYCRKARRGPPLCPCPKPTGNAPTKHIFSISPNAIRHIAPTICTIIEHGKGYVPPQTTDPDFPRHINSAFQNILSRMENAPTKLHRDISGLLTTTLGEAVLLSRRTWVHGQINTETLDRELHLIKRQGWMLVTVDKAGTTGLTCQQCYQTCCEKFMHDTDAYTPTSLDLGTYLELIENKLATALGQQGPQSPVWPRVQDMIQTMKCHKKEPCNRPVTTSFERGPGAAQLALFVITSFISKHIKDHWPDLYQTVSSTKDLATKLPAQTNEPPTGHDVKGLFSEITHTNLEEAVWYFAQHMYAMHPNEHQHVNTSNLHPDGSWKHDKSYNRKHTQHYKLKKTMRLLRVLLRHNYVNFQGTIYHQEKGVTTGGSASTNLADIQVFNIMRVAHRRITSAGYNIPKYHRYADDVLQITYPTIFKAFVVPTFTDFGLQLLQTTDPDQHTIPFLETNIHWNPKNKHITTSHHSNTQQLFPQAPRICSTATSKTECDHKRLVFGYVLRIYGACSTIEHFNHGIYKLRNHKSATGYRTKLFRQAITTILQAGQHNRYNLTNDYLIKKHTARAMRRVTSTVTKTKNTL